MKSTAVVCAVAAALLGLGGLAHAQPFERGEGGGRWAGQQRQQWRAQGGEEWRGRQRPPPQIYRGPPQAGPSQPMPPRRLDRMDRRGPPGVAPMPPQYVAPRYAPAPQYAPAPPQYLPPSPPPRWNHARGFRPGDALPPEYRQGQFVVRDWRAHRLYAPPPGYVWVQPEPGSYLLIGNNGVIANMLVGQ